MRLEKRSLAALNEYFRGEMQPKLGRLQPNKKFQTCSKSCGINEKRINPFTDLRGMFSNINFQFVEEEYLGKTQIHGHIVNTIDEIRRNVDNREKDFQLIQDVILNQLNLAS